MRVYDISGDYKMKILIVEDDLDKQKDIIGVIREKYNDSLFNIAASLTSGLQKLIFDDNVDLILLDMSMPNFESTEEEPSNGAPESFAGLEFLEQMALRGIETPVVIITQFVTFGKGANLKKFETLKEKIELEYPDIVLGMLRYSQSSKWNSELLSIIESRRAN